MFLLIFVGKFPYHNVPCDGNLTHNAGIGVNVILTPLAADMFYEAERLEKKNPEVFGEAGTYAQVYSLFCTALGSATAMGPTWPGLIYQQTSWRVQVSTLALISVLGSVGVLLYTGGPEKEALGHDQGSSGEPQTYI